MPDSTTQKDYLEKVLRLADTLISGRLGELPDDPGRAAFAMKSRLAQTGRRAALIAAGLLPLALYIPLHHLIPETARVPVFSLCVAWLASFTQFPNLLSMFGNTK